MDAMVLRVERQPKHPLTPFGTWPQRDLLLRDGDEDVELGAALLQLSPCSVMRGRVSSTNDMISVVYAPSEKRPRPGSGSSILLCPASPDSSTDKTSPPPTPRSGSSATSLASKELSNVSFTQIAPDLKELLTFSGADGPISRKRSLKRRRPSTDVDGENTAGLASKKRRLRRHLITSRLSQPFSAPASHILNREALATGDKRYLKLAAIMAARRSVAAHAPHGTTVPHHPSPSEALRRIAILNRVRLRVQNDATERGDVSMASIAANASILQQSHGLTPVVGSRFPAGAALGPSAGPPTPIVRVLQPNHPHPATRAAVAVRASPPGSPAPVLRPADSPRRRAGSLSPQLRPVRSPELRTTRPATEVHNGFELEEEESAFPTSEYESRYESSDDGEDVYADFSVIFGAGGGDGDSSDDESDHYEEIMDDLDGIPYAAR